MRCMLNNQTSLFSNCTQVDTHYLHVLALVRGLVGMVCFLLCLAAFLFEVRYVCSRKSTTLQRLFVYLTLSNLLYTAALSCHFEHYFTYNEAVQCYVCKIIGFFDQYTGSVQLLLTLGISFKLFHKMSSYCRIKKLKGKLPRRQLETLFVIFCFLFPLVVIWVPFLSNNSPGGYGQDGAWCWIQVLQENCQDSNKGFLEQLLLWYIPFALVSTLSLICVVAIIVFLGYICWHHQLGRTKIRAAIMDMLLLLPFLIAFCCVWLIEIITVILVRLARKNQFELNRHVLWMCYAVTTPIGGAVIPVAFFVYFLRSSRNKHHQLHQPVSNMRTVKSSTRVSPNSHTSQQERPDFLRHSDSDVSSDSFDRVERSLLGTSLNRKYGTVQ